MRVYIAAPYVARDYVKTLIPLFDAQGHEVTSTWANGTRAIHAGTVGPTLDVDRDTLIEHATGDLADVARSGALVMLTAAHCLDHLEVDDQLWLHTGGRQVELGYALSMVYPRIIIVGEPENIFQRAMGTIVDDIPGALAALA